MFLNLTSADSRSVSGTLSGWEERAALSFLLAVFGWTAVTQVDVVAVPGVGQAFSGFHHAKGYRSHDQQGPHGSIVRDCAYFVVRLLDLGFAGALVHSKYLWTNVSLSGTVTSAQACTRTVKIHVFA